MTSREEQDKNFQARKSLDTMKTQPHHSMEIQINSQSPPDILEPSAVIEGELSELLTRYANASFDCGKWDEEDAGDSLYKNYAELEQATVNIRKRIKELIREKDKKLEEQKEEIFQLGRQRLDYQESSFNARYAAENFQKGIIEWGTFVQIIKGMKK